MACTTDKKREEQNILLGLKLPLQVLASVCVRIMQAVLLSWIILKHCISS